MKLYIKTGSRYKLASPGMIAEAAGAYLDNKVVGRAMTDTYVVVKFLQERLANHERENFGVVYLDNKHRVIEFKIMFQGTIGQAAVYPREIVKHAMAVNAAAVIFAHNHPSGEADPSNADVVITRRLKEALDLVDVRVLDHVVIGKDDYVTFTEKGLL